MVQKLRVKKKHRKKMVLLMASHRNMSHNFIFVAFVSLFKSRSVCCIYLWVVCGSLNFVLGKWVLSGSKVFIFSRKICHQIMSEMFRVRGAVC